MRRVIGLVGLAVAAVLIHGYHPAGENGELYLPAIKQHLNPRLYPIGAEFFLAHAGRTFFDEIVAATIRWSHLPFDAAIFAWQFLSIVLLLAAAWRLAQ